ncbi:hypothetical protein [uncultured Arthrobacter sp.]|uniref:hypothetical protein n=1 Tax=uncultured Arthrobacter sp. TaxID=114050 RepID=UPI0025CD3105|nr:hypothetical protein [uncultured Arthrobacter sp.]
MFVDLVPASCWFTNVRSCVSSVDWARLRRPVLSRARHRCEACGNGEDRRARRWLEVHERWHYDEPGGVQALRRLICLCSPCHLVTHFGYANVTGRTDEAFAHLRRVTGMNQPQAWRHVHDAEQVWLRRSEQVWELDLGMLTGAGIAVRRPEPAEQRLAVAEEALRRADPPATRSARGHSA